MAKKQNNMVIILVILLIITIGCTIVLAIKYAKLMEEKNENNDSDINITTNIEDDEESNQESESIIEEVKYNIEGTYIYFIPNSEVVSYNFSNGKVIYSALESKEGTYNIIGNKIQITYQKATNPDGIIIDNFETQEQLIIIDNNTVEAKWVVDGGIRTAQFIKDNNTTDSNEEVKTIENNVDALVGKWEYYSIQENGEPISFIDVFGSSVRYGLGSLTFYKDGTFENYLPGASSSEIEDKGTFKVNGMTIDLLFKDKTETLTYYKETGTIEQNYGDYVLTLVREEN